MQECAAKGLALVYEVASADIKKKLVGSLMDTFEAGKKSAGPGAIVAPIALSAGGEGAYKELCAMATEVCGCMSTINRSKR